MVLTVSACLFGVLLTSAGWACTSSEIDVLGNGSQCETSKFQLTTTNLDANGSFNFWMSAKGTFYVDCGDGGTLSGTNASGKTISKTTNLSIQYTCRWSSAGAHTIKFGGVATEYASVGLDVSSTNAAIQFGISSNKAKIATVSGSLGELFPQLGSNENQIPLFSSTFDGASNLTSISSNLFSGLTGGANAKYMFYETFNNCTSLTSIPEGLFKDITAAANSMFYKTFANCSNLTGYIAPTTFAGLTANSSPTATSMWYNTFDSTQLATACPSGLPQYITGYEGNANSTSWNGKVSCGCMPGYAVSGGVCTACDNKPSHSYYVYNPSADSCPWQCDTGYSEHSNLCLAHYDDVCPGSQYYEISLDSCTDCPTGYTYNTTPGKRSVSECQIHCAAGTYVVAEYTELEYIESTGTQYIDTGVAFPNGFKADIEFLSNSSTGCVFGSWNGTNRNFVWQTSVSSLQAAAGAGGLSCYINPDITTKSKYEISNINSAYIEQNGTQLTSFEDTITYAYNNLPFYVFARNNNGTAGQQVSARLYSLKLYNETNELVRNFIPAKRNSDNAIGIYDRVTNTFFGNAGTGTFTSGADVRTIGGQCTDVGTGYYSSASTVNWGNTSTRSACVAGTYSNITNASACIPCAGATYADTTGASACTACPAGYTYNTTAGKTSASQCQTHCAAGTYVAGSYTELEYIESTGTQYIDTGFQPNQNTRIIMRYMNKVVNKVNRIFGTYDGNVHFIYYQATNHVTNMEFGTNANTIPLGTLADDKIFEVNIGKNTISVLDVDTNQTTTMQNTSSDFAVQYPIYLFDHDNAGASKDPGVTRIYSFRLYDDGTLVRDLIPVRRNSDNAVGMYDRVTNTFFGNAGTGTFTSGADVGTIGNQCTDVGAGYYAAASTVNWGGIGTRTACPAGTTTVGYGHGADEAADCGRELHVGDTFIYTKMTKPTTPAINIQMSENDIYYIGLSPTNQNLSKLHLMYNGQQYTAYDDSLLYGERDPATGNKITQ